MFVLKMNDIDSGKILSYFLLSSFFVQSQVNLKKLHLSFLVLLTLSR